MALYKSLARLQGHDLQLRSLVAHALYGTEARISAAWNAGKYASTSDSALEWHESWTDGAVTPII